MRLVSVDNVETSSFALDRFGRDAPATSEDVVTREVSRKLRRDDDDDDGGARAWLW